MTAHKLGNMAEMEAASAEAIRLAPRAHIDSSWVAHQATALHGLALHAQGQRAAAQPLLQAFQQHATVQNTSYIPTPAQQRTSKSLALFVETALMEGA